MSHMIAKKSDMMQAWTKSGKRLAVTVLKMEPMTVLKIDQDNSRSLIAFGSKKLTSLKKPFQGFLRSIGVDISPSGMKQFGFIADNKAVGESFAPSELFAEGDLVTVQGTSKGKGFTGVVKRYGFKGGPRTHGQSDRERAPGSSGMGTTPGRVFPGKRMPGRSGNKTVSMLNLTVLKVDDEAREVWVSGLVPGAKNGLVTLEKTGTTKFEGLK